MRKWMQASVRERVNAIKVNNLSSHEIEIHRPVLTRVLENLYTIHVPPLANNTLSTTNTTANTTTDSDARQAQPGRQLRRVVRRS